MDEQMRKDLLQRMRQWLDGEQTDAFELETDEVDSLVEILENL